MLHLPKSLLAIFGPFESLFSERVWEWVKVLITGAILAPGKRTVTSILQVMGLQKETQFQNYHRVLNRAVWSSREASKRLLLMLVHVFGGVTGPLIIGIDETIERRRGAKIAAKGIYRDPVRSSKDHFVKASGLRWVVMMLLVPIPWAARTWALPFFSVLAPSERYAEQRHRRHKKLTDWARQMLKQVRRWLPGRAMVIVADSSYAVIELLAELAGLREPLTLITRLRLDAALYDPIPARDPQTIGRPALKGKRQPTLAKHLTDPTIVWTSLAVAWYGGEMRRVDLASATSIWYHTGLPPVAIRWVLIRDPLGKFPPQALLCTDLTVAPEQILAWFVLRWQVEVTFHEVRAHLGVETQRQWSDLAILRTTPALLGLFSLVTLFAQQLLREHAMPLRQSAWYSKPLPTFIDTLAFVRQHLWPISLSFISSAKPDMVEIPRDLLERLTDALSFAA